MYKCNIRLHVILQNGLFKSNTGNLEGVDVGGKATLVLRGRASGIARDSSTTTEKDPRPLGCVSE